MFTLLFSIKRKLNGDQGLSSSKKAISAHSNLCITSSYDVFLLPTRYILTLVITFECTGYLFSVILRRVSNEIKTHLILCVCKSRNDYITPTLKLLPSHQYKMHNIINN